MSLLLPSSVTEHLHHGSECFRWMVKETLKHIGFFLAVLVLMMEDHTENAYKSVHTGYVVLTNIATCLDTI